MVARPVVPAPSVRIVKRALDVVGSCAAIAISWPLFPLIALAIKLDSDGPVIFEQPRAGRLHDGPGMQFEVFTIHKFRTMVLDAEATTGAVLAATDDPRATRVGRYLRRLRLDELPQLFDVLRGHMSLVGPRPERPEILAVLAAAIPFFEERMRGVKPGITGLSQVTLGYTGSAPETSAIHAFRDDLANPFRLESTEGALADDMRMKLLYDVAYAATLESFPQWLRMELEIILRTPFVMLERIGR